MRMKMICAAAGLLSVGFAAPGASASYMEECKAFISEWERSVFADKKVIE